MERSVDPVLSVMQQRPGSTDAERRLRATVMVMGWERFCYFWIVKQPMFDRGLVLKTLTDLWWSELSWPASSQVSAAEHELTR